MSGGVSARVHLCSFLRPQAALVVGVCGVCVGGYQWLGHNSLGMPVMGDEAVGARCPRGDKKYPPEARPGGVPVAPGRCAR